MFKKADNTMEHLRILFKRSGLSLEELGQRMGYSGESARKSAWQLLAKTTDPRLSTLHRFADALNVSIVDLVR